MTENHRQKGTTVTNTTDKAMTATRTIEQLGGLQRATWGEGRTVSAEDLLTILDLCAGLELEVPAELADLLANTATLYQRAHKLRTTPPTFSYDDLSAEDFEARFTSAMTGQLRALAKADAMIERAKTAAAQQAIAGVTASSKLLIELLNTVYPAHAKAEYAGTGPGFHNAHKILIAWQPGVPFGKMLNDYTVSWCLRWAWPQEAWNKLVSDTRPQMELAPGVNAYAFAIECGGLPRLTTSTAEASERSFAHRQAFQDCEAEKRAEAANAWEREQFDNAVSQGKAAQDSARAARARLAVALEEAQAAAEEAQAAAEAH